MSGKLERIWEALSACFSKNDGSLTVGQVLAWIGIEYPDSDFNTNTVRAQLYRSCVNVPSAQDYNTPKFLFYERSSRTYAKVDGDFSAPQRSFMENAFDVEATQDSDFQPGTTFALESHLRDYLAKNLQILEKGLQLWSLNPPSVEFTVRNRRIDILAKDTEDVPVVIELKRNMGYDEVVGQALLYQGLIASKLNVNRVRIIVVAAEVSEDLRIAFARQADAALFEYSISFEAKRVGALATEGA